MEDSNSLNEIYDYIIIGSGPSGAIMAKTLSDQPDNNVLLLEAGENDTEDEPITTSYAQTWRWFPQYFWQGRSKAQEYANQRLFNWSTGRTLGGGSSVNGEQYVRPSPDYFREWEQFSGAVWSPQQAFNFFNSMENYNGYSDNPEFHGYNGRVNIRQAPAQIPELNSKFVSAISQATGYQPILDYNDPYTPIGPFTQWQLFQMPDGRRESSATAYLSSDIMTPEGQGVNGRRLTVFMKTTALRILFNDNKEAIGVEFLKEGYQQRAFSSKSVILCAGINSSQILMLSGIGPAEVLNQVGVPLVYDNPGVGMNMINHTLNTVTFTANEMDLQEAILDRNDLYSGGAFLPHPDSRISLRRSIQLIGEVGNGQFTVSVINLIPESRGSITLQNNDPLKIALADYGFFNNQNDITFLKNVFRSYIIPIADVLSQIDPAYQLVSPTYDILQDDSRLENYIRGNMQITYHHHSFNRMAPEEQGGVVNQWGEVYGVRRLLIADCSILPFPVDCNTTSTAYYIGGTIANLLLQRR